VSWETIESHPRGTVQPTVPRFLFACRYPFSGDIPHVWVRAGNALKRKGDKAMKKRILTIVALAASVIGSAEARTINMWVFGSGTAQEDERESAVDEATDNATQQANAVCVGTVVDVVKTGTTCFGGGDNPYTCMVFVKAACQIQAR
jgi:hypothetical protein